MTAAANLVLACDQCTWDGPPTRFGAGLAAHTWHVHGRQPHPAERVPRRAADLPARPAAPTKVVQCGTVNGYRGHQRRHEKACAACLDANARNNEFTPRRSRARTNERTP